MAPVAIPTKSEELEAMLSDNSVLKNLASEGQFPDFIKAYANSVAEKQKDLTKTIENEVQLGLQAFFKENKVKGGPLDLTPGTAKAKLTRGGKGERYSNRAPGARVDNAKGSDGQPLFKDAAEFFQATWNKADSLPNRKELAAKREQLSEIQNSFGSTVPADGGFLIPEVLRSDLLQWSLETSLVRPLATVIPMDSLRVPIPTVDSTTNVGSVMGGIVCYWSEESSLLTESQAAFGRVVLDAQKLTAFAVVPNELIMDAPAFMGFFDQAFPKAISFFEDLAFTGGNGVGQPSGWLNNPATVTVPAIAGQGAGTIIWENIVAMYSRMLPASLGNAVWVVSPDTFPQLATMALSVGTGGAPVWLTDGSGTPRLTLLGRPVYITEKVPPLGTTGDISFVDLSYYLIGDRMSMRVDSSTDYRFQNDQTAFRIIERVAGRPWIQSAITPANGSANTLSPFVQLSGTRV